MLPIKRSDSSAPAKEDTADYLVEPVPLVPSSEASSVATTHVILPELHKMDSEFITPSFSSEEKPRSALRKRKCEMIPISALVLLIASSTPHFP